MKRRIVGVSVNTLLRASIIAFLADVLLHPKDPRYAGKAIPLRNLIVVGTLGHLFPALFFWSKNGRRWPGWTRYPVWPDNLYLSIFWLDMAGNAFNLYDRFTHFDLIPHCYGAGAFAAVGSTAFGWPAAQAAGIATAVHLALEAQENATDIFCGTHNVRGAWDTIGDITAGAVGTLLYIGAGEVQRALCDGGASHERRFGGCRWVGASRHAKRAGRRSPSPRIAPTSEVAL